MRGLAVRLSSPSKSNSAGTKQYNLDIQISNFPQTAVNGGEIMAWHRGPSGVRWVFVADSDSFSLPQHKTDECLLCPENAPKVKEIFSFENSFDGWWVKTIKSIPPLPESFEEGGITNEGVGMFDCRSGHVHCEVIIETPEHNARLDTLPSNHINEIFQMYRIRYLTLAQDDRWKRIMIFKNHLMGTHKFFSHPHSIIMAVPFVTYRMSGEAALAHGYYQEKDRCLYCDTIAEQRRHFTNDLVVEENKYWVAIVPFAARVPFEVQILCKRHISLLEALKDYEWMDLASITQRVIKRIVAVIGHDEPYSYSFHAANHHMNDHKDYHVHVEVLPAYGWCDMGREVYFNPIKSEAAADMLRKVILPVE